MKPLAAEMADEMTSSRARRWGYGLGADDYVGPTVHGSAKALNSTQRKQKCCQ
jgi:hypothetical protein